MESLKHRSSLDDHRQALRRFAHSPRLSLRRPASTTSSSASSIASHDTHEEVQYCVGRDSSSDDIALNRFIVWAAVKRNASQKMSPEERRECPLLRCRRRFDDHEQMLKHLATCDELNSGEYWCYDCFRAERFSDAKSKKCTGHPSKRRKAMTMAKNFFSSLGHRSKNETMPILDLNATFDDNYDSFNRDDVVSFTVPTPLPNQAELHSNEIHEIDSTPLPMILEDEAEEAALQPIPGPISQQHMLPTYSLPISPPNFYPTELESAMASSTTATGFQATLQPQTVVPASLVQDGSQTGFARPSLHVNTVGLEQARNKSRAPRNRSKYLGPSSSVRSTASTDSTNSTSTTASYAISPVSVWSNNWARGHEFESTLTSPADEFAPVDPFGTAQKPVDTLDTLDWSFDEEQFGVQFDEDIVNDTFLAQTSTDLQMLDSTVLSEPTTSENSIAPMDIFQMPSQALDFSGVPGLTLETSLDTSLPTIHIQEPIPDISLDLKEPKADDSGPSNQDRSRAPHQASTPTRRVSAKRVKYEKVGTMMIQNVFQSLHLHLTESITRLSHITNNPLADMLRQMSFENVARTSLETLSSILKGNVIPSSLELVCFVHFVFACSLVLHEEGASGQGPGLFSQAVSCASCLALPERIQYLALVNLLWRPSTVSNEAALNMCRAAVASSPSPGRVGKMDSAQLDSLAEVVRLFLEEIEYTVMFHTNKAEEEDGTLMGHDSTYLYGPFTDNHPLYASVSSLMQVLSKRYLHKPELPDRMRQLFDRLKGCHGVTTRRLEIGLLHIGKSALPSDDFVNSYVPDVRSHIDQISAQEAGRQVPRYACYQSIIRLISSFGDQTWPRYQSRQGIEGLSSGPEAIENIYESMASELPGFDFAPFRNLYYSCQDEFHDVFQGVLPNFKSFGTDSDTGMTTTTAAAISEPTTAATTPPSPDSLFPNAVTPLPGGVKIESDSCCELCGYRPEGDPRWFSGSMSKHKKLQHAQAPVIYACPYPGCKSQYKNRPDNLRQHQLKKGHFVEGEESAAPRPSKRKKMDS